MPRSVRNIREGIFRGNIFEKDMNPTDFCRDDWGNISETSCNKQFYSSYLCDGLISVVSLFPEANVLPVCSHKWLKWWLGFGAPVTLSMSVPRWELSERFLKGERT